METGILGLRQAGKTTLFNALTGASAPTGLHGIDAGPHRGVAKAGDPRLDRLAGIFKPKKVTPAEVAYLDVGAAAGSGSAGGLSAALLRHLLNVDALVAVVRAFDDPSVPAAEGIDPARDCETLELELSFADIALVDTRLERLSASMKSARAQERDAVEWEATLLRRIRATLEAGTPVRDQTFAAEEGRHLRAYQFLTAKPLLFVANIGEQQVAAGPELENALGAPDRPVVALSAALENELARLDAGEAAEFRAGLGAGAPVGERVGGGCLALLGYVSFLTAGPDEVRAWSLPAGTPAVEAAGRIHSDIQRGFIRAEVVAYDDLIACGSLAEARRRGVRRQEGKTYAVQDGDVIEYLFNV